MLPLMCIVALNFLLCLLTRLVGDEVEVNQENEKSKLTSPPPPPPPPPLPTSPHPASTPPPAAAELADPPSTPDAASAKQKAFFESHGAKLIPLLVKTAAKLLVYCHQYVVMIGDRPVFLPLYTDIPFPLLEGILQLAGHDPLQPKDSKPLFRAYVPDDIDDRLKLWSNALLIDPSIKDKMCSYDPGSPISDLMGQFLNLHFSAFTGTRTYDPARCLKSSLSTVMSLISSLFEMDPAKSCSEMMSIVPLACDTMLDFCGSDLLKVIKICGEKSFSERIAEYRVRASIALVQLPKMQDCSLLGPVLSSLFNLLSSMLDSPPSAPVLAALEPGTVASDACWPGKEKYSLDCEFSLLLFF